MQNDNKTNENQRGSQHSRGSTARNIRKDKGKTFEELLHFKSWSIICIKFKNALWTLMSSTWSCILPFWSWCCRSSSTDSTWTSWSFGRNLRSWWIWTSCFCLKGFMSRDISCWEFQLTISQPNTWKVTRGTHLFPPTPYTHLSRCISSGDVFRIGFISVHDEWNGWEGKDQWNSQEINEISQTPQEYESWAHWSY